MSRERERLSLEISTTGGSIYTFDGDDYKGYVIEHGCIKVEWHRDNNVQLIYPLYTTRLIREYRKETPNG